MKIAYVIGAGASQEIGMPIGSKLKKQILALLLRERDELRRLNLEEAADFAFWVIEKNY
jgi:short-subunit dehydrogenase